MTTIKKLTDSLNDTTQALSAAQALHAGTIQKQLTDRISNEESAPEQEEFPAAVPFLMCLFISCAAETGLTSGFSISNKDKQIFLK